MAIDNQPIMSKTQHYRKVTKPLLERKRRARMNHYLDELKELIIETMESNGEHVTKLEKADILELTVEYLKNKREQQQLQQQQIPNQNQSESELLETSDKQSLMTNSSRTDINVEKFRAGYTQAAYEVSKVFASVPGINVKFGSRLMKHLAYQLKDLYPVQLSALSLSSSSSSSVSDIDYDDEDNNDRKIIDKKLSEFIEFDNNKISINYHNYQHHNHQHQHHHHNHNPQNHNEQQFQYHNDRHHPYLLHNRNSDHHQQLSSSAAATSEQHHNHHHHHHNHHLNLNVDDIIINGDDEHKNLLPSVNDVWRPW